jgi:energy-coupling factor transport system ATP-binding protein
LKTKGGELGLNKTNPFMFMKNQAILSVKNLSYSYPAEKESIIKALSFEVNEGEFFSIIGPSGCGKTTLALTLNRLIPHSLGGDLRGKITIEDKDIKEMSTPELSQKVQILFQSPDSQLFALNVEDEISFGMENLNLPWEEIRKRINTILNKLSITNLRNRSIEELSSGQKQKVALASVLAMKPKILILDEPTANLDPVAVINLLKVLKKLKEEKITIILIEHNLDFVKEFSDRIMLMDKGKKIGIYKPGEIFQTKEFLKIMNPPSNKRYLIDEIKKKYSKGKKELLLEVKNMNFHYPNKVQALKNINLNINKGDFLGIVGLNGSGKSTLALTIIGLLKSKHPILFEGKNISKQDIYERTKNIGYVFQNPNYQLFEDNVFREIAFGLKNIGLSNQEVTKRVTNSLNIIGLNDFAKEDPHSLSVGQKRRVTIASVVSMLPKLIIVDEPDTGLDYRNAENLMDYLINLNKSGHTIILISHNLELIDKYCNRVVYLEKGQIKDIKNFFRFNKKFVL